MTHIFINGGRCLLCLVAACSSAKMSCVNVEDLDRKWLMRRSCVECGSNGRWWLEDDEGVAASAIEMVRCYSSMNLCSTGAKMEVCGGSSVRRWWYCHGCVKVQVCSDESGGCRGGPNGGC
ncbi:hypothetical protein DEO72_LG6g1041 [Vigna unguiculata]|uniref:Secreted protein n=1 Tax=Vigna unguiculata TaxID=3917 RepID=A0A4D6M4R5_VIGUN|nr:hypothetical protein DEO72_LG6g1041 [Vigna unguiculata]